jgi:hypothetical protein
MAIASIAMAAHQLSDRELIAIAVLGAIAMRAPWALHVFLVRGARQLNF